MQVIDKLKKMNSKELAIWMCNYIMEDDCDNCPHRKACFRGTNAIQRILEEQVRGRAWEQ